MSDLTLLHDSEEEKTRLLSRYRSRPLPAIYIPSYGRAGQVQTFVSCPALLLHATLVVHPTQELAYRDAYPHTEISVIDDSQPPSIGAARRWIMSIASEDHFLMLDDDLQDVRMIYPRGAGVSTRAMPFEVSERILGGLTLFAAVAEQAYEACPRAVMASPQSNSAFPKTFLRESSVRWRLNHQDVFNCISVNRDRYWGKVGYDLDLNKWGPGTIGEDKALSLETLWAGCDLVDVPSLLFKFAPTGGASTTIPRSREVYAKTEANYREYPLDMFTKPRYNAEMDVYDSWNIDFGRIRRFGTDRSKGALWTE